MAGLPTMEEMTSLYLYGQTIPPKNKGNQFLVSREFQLPYPVSAQAFMDGPGRFARASDFDYVNKFFQEKHYQKKSYGLQPGEYSKVQVMQHFGIDRGWVSLTLAMYDDGKDDLIERAYIWNTSAFMLDDRARFVVDPDGNRYIKDFAIRPYKNENFDFVGGKTSEIVNSRLRSQIDPEGIGRKVEITFTGDVKTRTLTEEGYRIERNQPSHRSWVNGAVVGAGAFGIRNSIIDRLQKRGVLYHNIPKEEIPKQPQHEKHSLDYNNPDWGALKGRELAAAILSGNSKQLDDLGKSFANSQEAQVMRKLGDNLLAEYKQEQLEMERQQELVRTGHVMVMRR